VDQDLPKKKEMKENISNVNDENKYYKFVLCGCTERKRNSCGNYIFDNSVI